MCVCNTGERISERTFHVTSAAWWESLASIITRPTQTRAWTKAKVPARLGARPAVCSRPAFFSAFLFPRRPRLTLLSLLCSLLPCTLFSSFPSVAPHLFSPPASHSSDTASRCGQLFNKPPLRQQGRARVIFLSSLVDLKYF